MQGVNSSMLILPESGIYRATFRPKSGTRYVIKTSTNTHLGSLVMYWPGWHNNNWFWSETTKAHGIYVPDFFYSVKVSTDFGQLWTHQRGHSYVRTLIFLSVCMRLPSHGWNTFELTYKLCTSTFCTWQSVFTHAYMRTLVSRSFFRTAVPSWGQTTQSSSSLPQKRDCGFKGVKGVRRVLQFFWY